MWPVHILPDEVYVNENVYVIIQTKISNSTAACGITPSLITKAAIRWLLTTIQHNKWYLYNYHNKVNNLIGFAVLMLVMSHTFGLSGLETHDKFHGIKVTTCLL